MDWQNVWATASSYTRCSKNARPGGASNRQGGGGHKNGLDEDRESGLTADRDLIVVQ